MVSKIAKALIPAVAAIIALQGGLGVATPTMQQGNVAVQRRLLVRPSSELADSGIGADLLTFSEDLWDNYRNPEIVYEIGFTWMRISAVYDPLNWQRVELAPGQYVVDPAVDEVITDYSDNGINIVLNLGVGSGPDCGAGNLANERPDHTRFKSEDDIRRYCDFARFIVKHFRGRVRYYEIWNEPVGDEAECPWGGIDIEDYVNLVRHVAPVIREADPSAKIVVGALGPRFSYPFPGYGQYSRCSLELEQFLPLVTSNVVTMIDVISWHPFYGTRPDDPYYRRYAELVSHMKDSAVAHGFRGEFLAEEIMWKRWAETDEPSMPVSPYVAAVYYARSVLIHRALGVVVTSNLWNIEARTEPIHTTFTSLCTVMAGCVATEVPAEIDIDYEPVAYCSFRCPNGDRILAVWTDGVAQEGGPGVMANITLTGVAAGAVTGIDVLNGLEQELVVETGGGNTVIRNLLVRDYPILIRLGGITAGAHDAGTDGGSLHHLGELEPETKTSYQQGFDGGDAVGWSLAAGWEVIRDSQGGWLLHGQGHTFAIYDGDVWDDYAFTVRVKLIKGAIHLNYRHSGCVRYFILFSETMLGISKTAPCGTHTTLRKVSAHFNLKRWYEVRVVGAGGKIEVYVDGALKITYTDPDPLLYGGIALETLKNSEAYVDDIAVSCPTE